MRIATWALGAALALSTAAADAAPQKGKSKLKPAAPATTERVEVKAARRPQYRQTPVMSNGLKSTPMNKPVYERGRIERIDDGAIFYSVAVKSELPPGRTAHALPARNQSRVMKMARIYQQTVTTSMIKNRIHGDEVELELRQDPMGYMYCTNITTTSAKSQK